jgi:acetyl esterase/lipase
MKYDPDQDVRLDPRLKQALKLMGQLGGDDAPTDVPSREAMLTAANSPEGVARRQTMEGMFGAMDNVKVAPKEGLRIEKHSIQSSLDGNTINLSVMRPDTDETLPCVYYIHGGGMMTLSCFFGTYQTWGRMIAHQGLVVVMVDFRNCLTPSSVPEVELFPAGLNDCVSGFLWAHDQAESFNIDTRKMLIAGESGGGNLSIATTMKLLQDGHGDKQAGLYAMCPYISGKWPRDEYPSSSENDGIFITIGNNQGAMAYGMEQLQNENPLAWPHYAGEDELKDFPPTMVSVNECDPLRDEGIAFYRKLMNAGVKVQCRQEMCTAHGAELFTSTVTDISRTTARDIRGWVDEC